MAAIEPDSKGFSTSYNPSPEAPYGDNDVKSMKAFDHERGSVDGFHGAVEADGT
jgi:hypothetical protein